MLHNQTEVEHTTHHQCPINVFVEPVPHLLRQQPDETTVSSYRVPGCLALVREVSEHQHGLNRAHHSAVHYVDSLPCRMSRHACQRERVQPLSHYVTQQ